ncbi:MAG: hypothetical protein M0Z46_19870 [Actinomycetota bacterium]|jgi:hypothetical protein|nr:hypothetical protein [Actinomycetota bacterium]
MPIVRYERVVTKDGVKHYGVALTDRTGTTHDHPKWTEYTDPIFSKKGLPLNKAARVDRSLFGQ